MLLSYSMFGPSPCPGHYPRRLATMTSADFCPITLHVAIKCAIPLTVIPLSISLVPIDSKSIRPGLFHQWPDW
ncbi:hypothetical protein ACFLZG_00755 [Thermodesulfobacteriota bacterium]